MSKRYEVNYIGADGEYLFEYDSFLEAQNKLLEIKRGLIQQEVTLNDLSEGICVDGYYLTVTRMNAS
jgi:hypothetical protein